MEDVKEKHSIRDLALAVAGNISGTDFAASLIVAQADGNMRITPIGAGVADTIQLLSLGAATLARQLKVLTPASPPKAPEPSKDGDWKVIAQEGETCDAPAGTLVRYGADGSFLTKVVDGPVACSNDVFGDPIFGTAKACSILSHGAMTVDSGKHADAGSNAIDALNA